MNAPPAPPFTPRLAPPETNPRLPREVAPPIDYGLRHASIIIASRNYGRFLPEAIESALQQTLPCEVIYSDDSSEDDSVAIARRYEPRGVIVLQSARHLGVCAARNRGVAASTEDYLIHLDGDDILPPDFVERHFASVAPGVPFVYGPAQAFGDGPLAGTFWHVPQWEAADPWQQNSVNTSAMYARWAFEAAGRWQNTAGTMWDWDLALRASRLGVPRTSSAVLRYRQHAHSWSNTSGERAPGYVDVRPAIRRSLARLSIGTIFSGRLPGIIEIWFEHLSQAVGELNIKSRPDLTILDNSRDDATSARIRDCARDHADQFAAIKILPHLATLRWESERQRRDAIANFMASAHNRIRKLMTGDLHWIVEDDVLVPPHAARVLFNQLTDEPLPHAVSGSYRCRHHRSHYIAGWRTDGHWRQIQIPGKSSLRVDYSGTGCLMFWNSRTPAVWRSHTPEGVAAHDWAWGLELTSSGGTLLWNPQVECTHAITETEHV